MTPWFNPRKAAQVVAFFAKEQGGQINVLKLSKLVYLADRKHMQKFDMPITGDNFVSMDHGPVNSITLNCVNGMELDRGEWDYFVSDREAYSVGVARQLNDDDLDELSVAELETLRETWVEFGTMGQYGLRDWTHNNCKEWEDPHGSSAPIPFSRIFQFLGKQNADELDQRLRADRFLRTAFAEA